MATTDIKAGWARLFAHPSLTLTSPLPSDVASECTDILANFYAHKKFQCLEDTNFYLENWENVYLICDVSKSPLLFYLSEENESMLFFFKSSENTLHTEEKNRRSFEKITSSLVRLKQINQVRKNAVSKIKIRVFAVSQSVKGSMIILQGKDNTRQEFCRRNEIADLTILWLKMWRVSM